MQIKVFSSPTLHGALSQIRQALGPDAVILDRHRCRDEKGCELWHVHAARDFEAPTPHPADPAQHRLASTARRLERIVNSLGAQETARLRASLHEHEARRGFDVLVRLGVEPVHAVDIAEDFANGRPVGESILHWGKALEPESRKEVVLLTGPGGGGKTTLAAKIATHFHLKGISVAFLSTDTERIGGLSALQTYADALEAPLVPLRCGTDIASALGKTESARLLLIDSEGWSNGRTATLRRQAMIWQRLAPARKFVVIPANMDEADGVETLAQARELGISELAITKLDETARPGKLINWMAAGVSVSYCSYGPDVPEQMGWLSAKALSALFAGHAQNWEAR